MGVVEGFVGSRCCTKCGETKPDTEFYRDAQKATGLRPDCKSCVKARLAVSGAAACRRWAAKNRDHVRALKRKHYVPRPRPPKDPTAPVRAKRAWKKRNQHRVAESRASRRALEQVPPWANKFFMREAFDLARRRTALTGIPWHVDHIVPIRSRLVSGLHCEANLQVILAAQNQSKGNRAWPDMPGT